MSGFYRMRETGDWEVILSCSKIRMVIRMVIMRLSV